MDISKGKFYYFSADLDICGLPTECEFVKVLRNKQRREAILIRCKNHIKEFGGEYLVVVPRQKEETILDASSPEEVVFLYTFGIKEVSDEEIDLERIRTIDVGGIVVDRKVLKKWTN